MNPSGDICHELPKVSLERVWIFKDYSVADILEEIFFLSRTTQKNFYSCTGD